MRTTMSNGFTCMEKSLGFILITFLIGLVALKYTFSSRIQQSSDIQYVQKEDFPKRLEHKNKGNKSQVEIQIFKDKNVISKTNLTFKDRQTIRTWKYMKRVLNHPDLSSEVEGGLKEALIAWQDILASIKKDKTNKLDEKDSMDNARMDYQCPPVLSTITKTPNQTNESVLQIPCGLIQDSSVTIVGIPTGLLGNFKIELLGAPHPGEVDAPIILHYNVRLAGDKLTEKPVIVQNTWTLTDDWGEEQRCPDDFDSGSKVDDLSTCSEQIGTTVITKHSDVKDSTRAIKIRASFKKDFWFPFVENYPFAATLWIGIEGFHMTVNGKHISSFEYRESLEPWLVNGIKIAGDIKILSVLANGLPSSENLDLVSDLESLKAPLVDSHKKAILFIGVFSRGNNFEHRMAVRRSWMQYKAVREGAVVVRFFVGMHNKKQVNLELWKEAKTYGDIQLMPIVDYYNLITLKTIAICIYGTKILNANYIMKTDDDAFVRVDAVLEILNKTKFNQGLLYGRISFESQPDRDPDSKWYISPEEWPPEFYPPWAHGPGYIISKDIAKFVLQGHQEKKLKFFKLEDVAMGIWIEEFKKRGGTVQYINDDRFYNTGCDIEYIVAHYQGPRHMLCLWEKLHEISEPVCCE